MDSTGNPINYPSGPRGPSGHQFTLYNRQSPLWPGIPILPSVSQAPALPSHFQMPRPLLGPSSLEPISHPCVHSCGSSSPLRKKKKSVKKHRRDRYPSSPGAFSHFMGPRTRALMIRVPESPQAGSREPFHGPTGLILGPGGRDGTGEW